MSRWVIVVDDVVLNEIRTQGLPHKLLFREDEWEDNFEESTVSKGKLTEAMKGAVIISAFRTAHTFKVFLRNLQGKAFVVKAWADLEILGVDLERREKFDA